MEETSRWLARAWAKIQKENKESMMMISKISVVKVLRVTWWWCWCSWWDCTRHYKSNTLPVCLDIVNLWEREARVYRCFTAQRTLGPKRTELIYSDFLILFLVDLHFILYIGIISPSISFILLTHIFTIVVIYTRLVDQVSITINNYKRSHNKLS